MTYRRWRVARILLLAGVLACPAAWLFAQPAQPEPTPAPGVEEDEASENQDLNAIREVLQQLLPQPVPPMPKAQPQPQPVAPAAPFAQPAQADRDDPADKRELDAYDKLIPLDPDLQADWSRAQKQAAGDNWGPVLQMLKRLNERGEDSLTVLEDGSVTSFRRAVVRHLSKAPRDVRDTFERTYRADGERLLKEALADQSLDKLSDVATRFFWIEPGYVAADALATRLMDRGDTGIALTWFKQLWEAQPSLTQRTAWQRKAAIAAHIVGDSAFEQLMTKALGADVHAELIAKFKPRFRDLDEPLTDWPMFLGSSRRNALARGSEPVNLQRWRAITTSSTPLQTAIDNLYEYLAESSIPAIPTAMPLLVNGKVVFRSFSGLEVLDAESGRLLWSLEDGISADAVLMDGSLATAFGGPNGAALLQGNSHSSTGGPLGQYLFQNSNHALLSSDGRRLFVVDDNPLIALYQTSGRIPTRGNRTPAANRLGANVLRAYDLESGRMLWQTGGPVVQEDLTAQLPGTFFLGAPVVDGDDLFVVGQRDAEIRLHVLEPATGHVKWSQLLSYADMPIERDALRRVWAIQPSVQGSLIICPTTVGWLVAVDRSRHSVLWAQRYFDRLKPDESDGQRPARLFAFGNQAQVRSLNEEIGTRWATSAPVIARNRVLMTPIEAEDHSDYEMDDEDEDETSSHEEDTGFDAFQCFDLYTGKRVWKHDRGELNYVAGVWNDCFILAGNDQVLAIGLDGKEKWKLELPAHKLLPSGRGILADGYLYQPTMRREVLKVDLATGKLASSIDLTERDRPLGNLLLYRGLLISHHPGELVALEQLAAVEQRLSRKDQQPASLDNQLLEAELALSRGQDNAALETLRKIKLGSDQASFQERYQLALRRALVKAVRRDPAHRDALLTELEALVKTPKDRQEFDELAVSALVESGNPEAAVRRLLLIARRADETLLVRSDSSQVMTEPVTEKADTKTDKQNDSSDDDDDAPPPLPRPTVQLHVSEAVWVQGLIRDLWPQLESGARAALDREIESLLKETTADMASPRAARIVRMLNAHPAVVPSAERFAADAAAARQYVMAHYWLEIAQQHAPTPLAALERRLVQTQLSLDFQDLPTAELLLRQVAEEATAAKLDSVLAAATALSEKLKGATPAARPAFAPKTATILHMPNQNVSHPTIPLEPARRRPDFFAGLHVEASKFEYSPTSDRLRLSQVDTGETYWSLPLRANSQQRGELQMRRSGQSLIAFNGGVLQAFSLPDRRVLWSVPVALSETDEEYEGLQLDESDSTGIGQMVPAAEFVGTGFHNDVVGDGLLFANSEYVAVRARQQLQVFDVRTGELRWMAHKLIDDFSSVTGTTDTLWINTSNDEGEDTLVALRALDGKPLPRPEGTQEIRSAIFIDDDNVVSAALNSDAKRLTLQSRDHRTGQTVWKHEFDARTEFCKTADDEVVACTREGQVIRIDLWNGHRVNSDPPPPALRLGRGWRQVVTDREHVYLLLNPTQAKDGSSGSDPFDWDSRRTVGSVTSLWSHGVIIAFRRDDGRQVWTKNTSKQTLVLSDFLANPTLLFLHYDRDTFGFGGELQLEVVNKTTGERLLKQVIATDQLSFTSAQWDPATQLIDLSGFERRYRLVLKP